MASVFSWQNSISLCPASFCTPRPNLPVTPGVSWLPTFAFQSLWNKRISFYGVSSRRSCRSSKNQSALASLASGGSLVAQMVKNLPAVQKTWVQSLGWEDPLETGMATHSSILAWSIPWTEEPGGLPSLGLRTVGDNFATKPPWPCLLMLN